MINQIIFIGLRSIREYYTRPGGVAGVYGTVIWEEVGKMGPSGNRDCQWASRGVLRDALTIPAGSLLALIFD